LSQQASKIFTASYASDVSDQPQGTLRNPGTSLIIRKKLEGMRAMNAKRRQVRLKQIKVNGISLHNGLGIKSPAYRQRLKTMEQKSKAARISKEKAVQWLALEPARSDIEKLVECNKPDSGQIQINIEGVTIQVTAGFNEAALASVLHTIHGLTAQPAPVKTC
jgi:hypothetical protein